MSAAPVAQLAVQGVDRIRGVLFRGKDFRAEQKHRLRSEGVRGCGVIVRRLQYALVLEVDLAVADGHERLGISPACSKTRRRLHRADALDVAFAPEPYPRLLVPLRRLDFPVPDPPVQRGQGNPSYWGGPSG
jgi:hypothetical protein